MRPRSLSCLHPQRLSNLLVTLTYGLHHFKTMQERSERQDTSRSREFDPLLLHRRRSYLHIHVQLSPPFPCHDDPILMSLSLAPCVSLKSQDFPAHRNHVPQSPAPSIPSYAATWYAPQHSARGKHSCCVFVIPGALTSCDSELVRWRSLTAAGQFAGAKSIAPSSIRDPHSQGALTYYGNSATTEYDQGRNDQGCGLADTPFRPTEMQRRPG
ncbi:hypothetical protein DFP72DRAFT_855588 [Ephemerocybe angulata]|uniref:Uncharacterized protein n=1 Tax=Ephemerocybe angulata TaxID=980116 RepID=A0A8H6HGV5_9AGAR|nr:hypothetical protein DFP72DRAFT_855588 [Tulosesus angulatus]